MPALPTAAATTLVVEILEVVAVATLVAAEIFDFVTDPQRTPQKRNCASRLSSSNCFDSTLVLDTISVR